MILNNTERPLDLEKAKLYRGTEIITKTINSDKIDCSYINESEEYESQTYHIEKDR